MASPAVGFAIDLTKLAKGTVILSTSFHHGIGNMKQIRGLKIETTADPSRLHNTKKLLDVPELETIRSEDSRMRRYIELKTATYSDGLRFLNLGLLDEVDAELVAYQSVRRPRLVADFMVVYRAEHATGLSATRLALGDTFREEDYPHPDTVEHGFYFEYQYLGFNTPEILGTVKGGVFEREAHKAQSIMLKAAEESRQIMRQAGLLMAEKLFDVLKPSHDGKKKKLYDTHLTNLEEYLKTYNFRDITDDAGYLAHVETLRKIMSGVTINKLRESETMKSRLAEQLESVTKDMKSLVIETGRKFR